MLPAKHPPPGDATSHASQCYHVGPAAAVPGQEWRLRVCLELTAVHPTKLENTNTETRTHDGRSQDNQKANTLWDWDTNPKSDTLVLFCNPLLRRSLACPRRNKLEIISSHTRQKSHRMKSSCFMLLHGFMRFNAQQRLSVVGTGGPLLIPSTVAADPSQIAKWGGGLLVAGDPPRLAGRGGVAFFASLS